MAKLFSHQKSIVAIFGLFSGANAALAKECDSELNGNLLKVNSHLKANAEFFLGVYNSNFKDKNETTYTPMVNFASEISSDASSSFFLNGSVKYKIEDTTETAEETSSEGKKGAQVGNWRIGLRDAYFRSHDSTADYKLGFMTYTVGEQLLLDDRALGFDAHLNTPFFAVRVFGAGVLDPFAREKQSCISKNTFVPKSEEIETTESSDTHAKGKGRNFAITKHFGGIRLDFGSSQPQETKQPPNAVDDEFEAANLNDVNTKSATYGLIYFVEAKDDFSEIKHFPGLFGSTSVASIELATEVAVQLTPKSSALGYIGKAYRSFVFGNEQVVKLFSGYTAYNKISGNDHFSPSYANMFLGEAAQYLTKDNNVVFGGTSYRPTETLSIDLGSYHKVSSTRSAELDLSSTYYYYARSKLKVGTNWLYGPAYSKNLLQAYAEIRHIF